jgi:hypothetical protein
VDNKTFGLLKKYWWLFPILGLIVWAVLFYSIKSSIDKKMAGVREAKADKSVSDLMNKEAEEIQPEGT